MLDDEGEDGDDGLVWEAGFGIELNEGEEGYLARSYSEVVCISIRSEGGRGRGGGGRGRGPELTEIARHGGNAQRGEEGRRILVEIL